jgi:hypothetical protein
MSRKADNLNRWRESGGPKEWVKAHRGEWADADWQALLEALRASPYWPMHEADIRRLVEAIRVKYLRLAGAFTRLERIQGLFDEWDETLKAEGRSDAIHATTLAEAVAQAERLAESNDLMLGINSLWAWYCSLPVEKQQAIGEFTGPRPQHDLWLKRRSLLRNKSN